MMAKKILVHKSIFLFLSTNFYSKPDTISKVVHQITIKNVIYKALITQLSLKALGSDKIYF